MPRPRSFDEDAAVDAACRVFWERGYEATSTEDLCAATGLGRSSLYNTFTGKRALYESALARYMEQRGAAMRAILDGEGTARERIAAVIRAALDPDPGDPAGCFVVNASMEPPGDDGVGGALRRHREDQVAALRCAVEEGRRDGSITSARPPQDLARFVHVTIGGLQVAARAGIDRATREAVAATALDAL